VESIPFNSDWTELLAAFNGAGVRYLVVGAFAYARYAPPRATGDLDLWVDRTTDNAKRVFKALSSFGAPLEGVSAQDFAEEGFFYSFGNPPIEVDVITEITNVSFDDAWAGRDDGYLGGIPVSFIGRDAFLRNKRATGRLRDRVDVEAVEKEGPLSF
jgi:hypothetical protein